MTFISVKEFKTNCDPSGRSRTESAAAGSVCVAAIVAAGVAVDVAAGAVAVLQPVKETNRIITSITMNTG
jgi:ABC-type uncharacterized transport system permease subunit